MIGPAGAQAGSVAPMNVPAMADLAGQVIVGTVTSAESRWAEDPRRIETVVVFCEVQYLKGRRADSTDTFTLIVPGGCVGTTHMRICCAPEFRVGERWLLFLLPTYKTFPVVGLSQGAFRIRADSAGIERVFDAAGSPVVGLDDARFVRAARRTRDKRYLPLVAAENVRLKETGTDGPAGDAAAGITLSEFTAVIRADLEASRAHELTGPAGRPAAVKLRAVGLVRSEVDAAREISAAGGAVAVKLRCDRLPEEVKGPTREAVSRQAPKTAGSGRGQRDGK